MEWVRLGNLVVSKDGFVILCVQEDDTTTVHMPCIDGHIAHVGSYDSLESARKGTEYMLSDDVEQHYSMSDKEGVQY